MKTAVVYYTRDGNTRLAAGLLAEKFGADVYELEEARPRGRSAGAFMAAGFGASVGLRSRLKNDFSQQMKAYGTICIGSPVWAGKTSPAFNAFVRGLDAKGNRIVLFTVQADPQPEAKPPASLQAHKKQLEQNGATVTHMLRLHGAPPGKTASKEHILTQIELVLPT